MTRSKATRKLVAAFRQKRQPPDTRGHRGSWLYSMKVALAVFVLAVVLAATTVVLIVRADESAPDGFPQECGPQAACAER